MKKTILKQHNNLQGVKKIKKEHSQYNFTKNMAHTLDLL